MPRKLDGTYIQTGSITTTQLSSAVTTQISAGGGPRVTSLVYPGNDTAANTVGGQTVYIIGSGFDTNNAVYINGNAVPSKSFISASNVSFTTPALSAGLYPVYFINTDTGATAIFVPGLSVSAEPAWVTSAGSLSGSQDEGSAWSYSLSATGDAPITYALAAGSSLPTGISLASNGVISGTISSPTGNVTTYTFSVVATDAQNQDSTRQFSVTTSTGEGVLFANNVLLIHADGTNNQNNHAFLDSSNNNFTITRYGNATQGSFSPFSQTGWGNYFDGSTGYLTTSSTTLMDVTGASQSFTIEAWIYPQGINASGPQDYRFTSILSKGVVYLNFGYTSTGVLRWYTYSGSANYVNSAAGAVQNNAWQHVAVVSNAGAITLYLNGISVATGSLVVPNGGTGVSPKIGSADVNYTSDFLKGYISNLRVTNTAVYTATFTPPTVSLTAIANTQLLTCQSNRFVDNSDNAFAITRNGDVSVQAFSPFAPTAAYSTANVGGSGYFDGTGDWLNAGAQTAYDFGTGDFTIEAWVYGDSSNWAGGDSGGFTSIADTRNQSNSTESNRFSVFVTNTGSYPGFYNAGSNVQTNANIPISVKAWNHIAWTRSSGTIKIWVNGVQGASFSDSTSFTVARLGIGSHAATSGGTNNRGNLIGYLSNFRWVKGTAVYTNAFTPPTAPLTNIANTSLLLNFTNAGIFDQTAKNILETVGDAKVSTTQYKYGTASMYFDGSGDWIYSPTTVQFNPTQKFTVEFWTYPNANTTVSWIVGSSAKFYIESNAGTLYVGDGTTNIISTAPPSTGAWTHVALTYDGTTYRLFYNGTSQANSTTSLASNVLTAWYIGARHDGTRNFDGYIDDLRITKGYARYTTNFTAPTSALKDK